MPSALAIYGCFYSMILLGVPDRGAFTGPGPDLIVFFLVYLLIMSSFLFDLGFCLWVISVG